MSLSQTPGEKLLQTIDSEVQVSNQVVGLQEYGVTNKSLIAGLEARGATVEPVRVYGWDFPEDSTLLRENVGEIAAGNRDLLLVTSRPSSRQSTPYGRAS